MPKAEEFYNLLEERIDFTKLTNTGISNNYENVFNFAESYAKEELKELTKYVRHFPTCRIVTKTMVLPDYCTCGLNEILS